MTYGRDGWELPSKDTDGHHRQNVVEPAERMHKAPNKPVHLSRTGMSGGGGGNERESGGHQASAHGGPSVGEQTIRSQNCTSRVCPTRVRRSLPDTSVMAGQKPVEDARERAYARPSMSSFEAAEGEDARDKRGHDERESELNLRR